MTRPPPPPPHRPDFDALLAAVSRSFYLSLRVLPQPVRAPLGLAYLLARASDSIADCGPAPPARRLAALAAFRAGLAAGTAPGAVAPAEFAAPDSPEWRLLALLPECFAALAALARRTPADGGEIVRVLGHILDGQESDVRRSAPVATDAELDQYIFNVAGAVGEFWTRICCRHLPRYARRPEAEQAALGIRFGKGLQLVNILRDLPADLRAGRRYLPGDPAESWPRWRQRCAQELAAGCDYVRAVRPIRVRFACFLPWYLGLRTLAMLPLQPPAPDAPRLKVPRRDVRRALLWGWAAALSNRCLAHLANRLRQPPPPPATPRRNTAP